jgi:hypothetical protein
MATGPHSFKRLLLGLQSSSPDRTVQLAVELADLLQLELLGLFLEDTVLRDLAGIPVAREFRPLGGGWQPINLDRLLYEMELSARNAERMFAEAAKRLRTRHQFEVIRGRISETIMSISRSGDIVMIVEPVSPAERATQQFSWLMEAAFGSAAAVLLVPSQIARTKGPVVAIAAGSDDPSIELAAAIAIAAKEDLAIIAADERSTDDPRIRKLAADTGLTIVHFAAGNIPLSDPRGCAQAFRQLTERLVVVTRGVLANEMTLSIASSRRIPVLVVESPVAIGSERAARP